MRAQRPQPCCGNWGPCCSTDRQVLTTGPLLLPSVLTQGEVYAACASRCIRQAGLAGVRDSH
eukprot:366329-Chlamydomonas_euryale.AAC.4